MIKDDTGHLKVLVFGGMVVLAMGLGYSMGLNQMLESPASQIRLGPVDPESIGLLKQAGERARAAGDAKTAEWLEQACDESSKQLLAWATAKAHGSPRVQAAAR